MAIQPASDLPFHVEFRVVEVASTRSAKSPIGANNLIASNIMTYTMHQLGYPIPIETVVSKPRPENVGVSAQRASDATAHASDATAHVM